jgi:hypothetical protein
MAVFEQEAVQVPALLQTSDVQLSPSEQSPDEEQLATVQLAPQQI